LDSGFTPRGPDRSRLLGLVRGSSAGGDVAPLGKGTGTVGPVCLRLRVPPLAAPSESNTRGSSSAASFPRRFPLSASPGCSSSSSKDLGRATFPLGSSLRSNCGGFAFNCLSISLNPGCTTTGPLLGLTASTTTTLGARGGSASPAAVAPVSVFLLLVSGAPLLSASCSFAVPLPRRDGFVILHTHKGDVPHFHR